MARQGRRTASDQRRRQLGQNFLHDPRAIQRVVDLAAPSPDDVIVELCAGTGALTRALAEGGCSVTAVELDGRWAAQLRRSTAHLGSVTVVHGDALVVDLPPTPFRVVGNLAFGIGTELLRRLLTAEAPMRDATIVLQLQAARRLVGDPATGRFSLTWSPWFSTRLAGRISRGSFRPVPRVDAGIVTVHPRSVPWLSPARFAEWDRFVSAAFSAAGRTGADRLAEVSPVVLASTDRRALDRPPSQIRPEIWVDAFRAHLAATHRRSATSPRPAGR